ncbi:hypothetical protein PsYK624_103010 [Phanerochaete sordida]|uniref:GmrSD restriction endonucleases N-terminal domain-containing protein n=1 Tax=Phanerochaete sordida TaxID=48140 RepID=A0A9P3GFT5_9APHY|nr:hypothetical protein PsYK624_103010 [Phanerochaete sordida]
MWSDYESDSDLTDLGEDDEDYEPSKRKKSSKQAKIDIEYTISNALRPPRAANYATKYIYDLMVDCNINLDPQYQRDVVWPESKQIGLIDSLMRNYYVPPIIFAVKRNPMTGEDVRVCIDGKQRLTSLRRFLDGEIAHKDLTTGKKYFFKQAKGAKRAILPQTLVRSFQMKQIVCMEYSEIDEEQEREIFQRVQMGMALTVAERMQAISGPWSDIIREIQAAVIGEEGFGTALDWETGRGRDFQNLALIVYLITEPKVTYPTVNQLEKWLQQSKLVPAKLHHDVLQTFRIFVHLVRDPKYSKAFQKPARISPIEFIMTGYAIYTFGIRGRLTYAQLSSVIIKMRETARRKHADVRANKKVMTTMHKYLLTVSKKPPPHDPEDDDTPASEAINGGAKKTAKAVKRKRNDVQEEDEEEPPRRAGPSKTIAVKAASTSKTKAKTVSKATSKASAPKATGSKTTVKKVATSSSVSKASGTISKATKPATQPSASTSASASSAKNLPHAASSTASQSSSGTATPQQASTVATSENMGPPAVPRRSTQDEMDVDTTAQAGTRGSADRQSPSTSRATPAEDAMRRNSTSNAQVPLATPPPVPRATASPPVAIKPDPDGQRRGTIFDRLAPIRAARGGQTSPVALSPSTSLFAQHQQQFFSSASPPSSASPTLSISTSALAPFLQRPPVATAFQANAARPAAAPAHPQITAAAVQSMLARGAGQSPTSPTAPVFAARRPSVSLGPQSPSPAGAPPPSSAAPSGSAPPGSGAAAQNSGGDAAQDKSHSAPPAPGANAGGAEKAPPQGPRSLSPTLPRRPERMAQQDEGNTLVAARMSPEASRGSR